jgi:hypothetical protein
MRARITAKLTPSLSIRISRTRNTYPAGNERDCTMLVSSRFCDRIVRQPARVHVLALYKRRSSSNSLLFLETVIEKLLFPIQRIQTETAR